jgi:hypothetical protein
LCYNEWGFSCRVADLIGLVAAQMPVATHAKHREPETVEDLETM